MSNIDQSLGQEEESCVAFADAANDFLSQANQGARCRQLRHAEISFDRQMWKEIADAGWLSVIVPEADGGLGLDLKHAAAIAQAAGAHLLPEPLVSVGIQTVAALCAVPESALKNDLITRLIEGKAIIGLAWQEAVGQLDVDHPGATVKVVNGQKLLTGTKLFVEPGAGADGWLVLACAADGPVLVWVRVSSEGVFLAHDRRVDGILWSTLTMKDVPIGDEDVLAIGEQATKAIAEANDCARLMQGAELVGLARQALAITLEYVKTRVQFGKPIGSFQALQHRLVDASLQVELAAATLREAMQIDGGSTATSPLLASRVKARAAQAALEVTRLAIQMHGAMGNTDECDIGLYFKRVLALNASLGTASAHRLRYFSLKRADDRTHEDAAEALPPGASEDWEKMSDAHARYLIRSFLEENYPKHLRHLPRPAHWDEVCDWYKVQSKRGWCAPAWPKQYGGMGLSPARLMLFHDEMERFGVARWVNNAVEMLGPLLINFGTEEQRNHYLPRILSGEHVWCQGYSEPNAGSDLASLKTFAALEGDSFRINGRKIWTTHGDMATHMFMLVRTDKTAKSHSAISFLLVDLKTPGITIRPIEDLTGDVTFCEVTFDDVIVPSANLVGELNKGWGLAKALLGFERLFIANPAPVLYAMTQLTLLAKQRRLFDDASFAARYAQFELDVADLIAFYNRFADILKRGEQPAADISLLKIYSTETWQRLANFLVEAADESGANIDGQNIEGEDIQILSPMFNALPSSLYGGSNEIQRNIVARQVLGLPSGE